MADRYKPLVHEVTATATMGAHPSGEYVRASDYDALAAELAECRDSRQREHDLRVTIAGELESFKIRYQDEVGARVNAENELDAVRSGFVAELRKAKAALATARIAALARQRGGPGLDPC